MSEEELKNQMSPWDYALYQQLKRIADALEKMLLNPKEMYEQGLDKLRDQWDKESAGEKPVGVHTEGRSRNLYESKTIQHDSKPAPLKKGKYEWYPLLNDPNGKLLRKCENPGCPLWLRYNDGKKSYEHWKYDANTTEGYFVQDKCDYYQGG